MLIVTAKLVELRGVVNKFTKSGTPYFLVNVEDNEGNPYQFYCKDFNALEQGLKKGDLVDVDFEYKKYNNEESLVIHKLYKS